ncbi:MAG: ABC transporter permease [Gemmatimonadetes bacterium]|nr:ABC transporter permease [Gemmatimonadota bacterium]
MASRLDRSPLAQLTLARFREFLREKEAVFWTFVFPVLLAVGLGVAFRNRGPDVVAIGVAAGADAGRLAAALGHAEGVRALVLPSDAVDDALRKGRVALVVASRPDGLHYRFDPTRPESRLARLAADEALAPLAGRPLPPPARIERVTAPGARYIDFLIPGLIAFNLLGTGLWGVGFALVRMRTGKLLKRFLATPMRKSEFLFSFILARLSFLVLEVGSLLLFARYAFDVRVHGSIAAVFAVAILGAMVFSGIGLLVASRARTQEAVMGLMNVVSLPMWILSGVFFSAEHFPAIMQPLIRALPLTAVVDALRAIMNDGATLAAVAGPVTIALAWGVASFAAALAIFRWR